MKVRRSALHPRDFCLRALQLLTLRHALVSVEEEHRQQADAPVAQIVRRESWPAPETKEAGGAPTEDEPSARACRPPQRA